MEETKRRRYIIRAVLEGEVDVSDAPVPVSEYPKTLTDADPGIGFGSYDATKNTAVTPYVGNANRNRIHCIGENALGYPVQPGKSYRVTLPEEAPVVSLAYQTFNEYGYAELVSVSAVSDANRYDSGWIDMSARTCVITPAQINGKDAVCFWLGFKNNVYWSAVSDICPIVIEEI